MLTSFPPSRVSVVIPNFNRSGLINETVRNALAQSLTPHEIFVIDDGSTDDSVESLRSEFGDNICVIEQANQGPGAARNAGLERVTGDYVWLMDSDDLASLNKLEVQVAALRANSADVVYGPWARVFFDQNSLYPESPVLQQRAVPSERSVLEWFMTDWSLVFQHCLFRATAIKHAGYYRTDLWTCDDTEYFVRVLSTGAKTVFEDQSITLYRCNDTGKVTGSGFQDSRRMTDWAHCLLAMAEICGSDSGAVRHRDFQLRLWRAERDLRQHCADEQQLIGRLSAMRSITDSRSRWLSLRSRLSKALRRRMTGSAWGRAFACGPFREQQIELIQNIGYTVQH